MDYIFLEEDEQYQTQCGEMFFTTKGRLIFHCTLCEKKFSGFDSFEVHIKEHIPILNDGQADETVEQQYAVDFLDHEFEESVDNEDQVYTGAFIKEEYKALEEALMEEEMPLADIRKQNRVHLKSGKKVVKNIKHKANFPIRKVNQSQKDQSATRATINKTQKDSTNNNVQIPPLVIPPVVREVQSRVHPRSMLTPAEDRKHKCPVCEVAFKDRHNMIHHLKRHSGNKDHKCPECGKGFYTTTEVRIHMRSHKNERPFLCNMCGRAYVSNSHLLEHLKRHSNQRNHKCEICQKAFFNKTQLMGHMVGHSSERPFSCEICSASFTRRKALINHKKLHENKREFKCELCDSGFNQRAGLFSHMKTAHKGE